MRLFAAVIPPAAALGEVAAATGSMRRRWPTLRWTSPEHQHVTLAFLGEVPGVRLPCLGQQLALAAAEHPPLLLRLAGAGRFDGRVLWLGVQVERGPLDRLAGSVATAARLAGVPVEQRDYHPHVTLARARGRAPVDLRPVVRALAGFAGSAWPAEEVALVESRPGAGPSRRPAYERLAAWRLG